MPTPCIVVSDLHLFAKRSLAHQYLDRIHAAARGARALVLAGDIVDFKWSQLGSVEATVDAAEEWLEHLLAEAPDLELHYVLGNHDHLPQFVQRLDEIAARHPRLQYEPFHLRLGNAFFLHGDVGNSGMNAARLVEFRTSFADHRPQSARAARLYDAAMAARLHVVGARLTFPKKRLLGRIHDYLDETGNELSAGVRNVYFGHTHLALANVPYRGRLFHNCGAPMPGLDFRIIEADLS